MDTKLCPYCREVIKIEAVKCKHCQTVLSGPSETIVFDPATGVRLALAAKYEFAGEIGRGGMAIVYKAVHKRLGRTVALKVLPQQLAYEKELLERFHREARSLASLKHPSIVPVYDEGFENGVHYFAMEYLEGKSLSANITEKRRLQVQDIVPIIIQIADALDYIHAHGLVHRDVKSANIFITRQGVPVLMDFGVAHVANEQQLTAKGMILGTPEFMSPEQAGGMEIDGKSDLYSLGVVMYQALSGAFPHTGDTPLMTLHKIVTEPYTPLRDLVQVPEWMEYAVGRCLEKDPTKRVQSGKVLAQLLREQKTGSRTVTNRKAISASRQVPPRHVRTRKNGMGWKVVAGSILVVALALIGFFAKAYFVKPPEVAVPSVVWETMAGAERKLTQSQLKLGGIERKWGMREQHDLVIEQRPAPGAKLPPGSTVVLVIGIGKTEVPDLRGMFVGDAIASLRNAALALGETTRVAGPPDQHNRVMMMYPRPGDEVGKDARVNLSIGE